MQDLTTGEFRQLSAEEHGLLGRLFGAAKMEAPLFKVGDEIEIRNGRFRVLALDGHLLVLEGIPSLSRSLQSLAAEATRLQREASRKETP